MPATKKLIKYGNKVTNIMYADDNILIFTDKSIKIIDKNTLSPKYTIANVSKYQSIHENKIVTVGENVKVINFKDDILLTKFLLDNISCVTLSSVLIGVGKNSGAIAIHSIIGGKNLINLNIFKTKIENISFYTDYIVIAQSKNLIKGINIIEKKIEFKYNDTANITSFTIANDLCFIANQNNELKIYDLKNSRVTDTIYLDFCINKMKYENGLLIMQYENGFQALNIDTSENFVIDEDIKPIIFDSQNDELIAVDTDYNIVKYTINDLIPVKEEPEEDTFKVKFLTVDDSSTMRLIIKNSILNNFEDVEVYEAEDGVKCLDVLKKNPEIDIIFMDWNMPNLNGSETVDKIRENPIYNHIKIIMATTEGAREKVREMVSKGVKGYLVKPFKPESVVPLAQKMIEIVREEKNVQ
ncbi:response regulator [Hydrogenimonas thermophila]|uniref:CheY chemotaxis protein or a CheY-like REC (Receiver) domain n=1 Tax=Hydrogenimonas thermophila TaxID=223786 RepID=A0A1I5KW06_9BACT|nr:response regulator [Hydrogenimonas thermophila]SFO88631.1 CheY chemotaxis protein or a CheY-like REC (receiver) domain [Hydrogenimonas thermophila]